jgi:hypothetical protein
MDEMSVKALLETAGVALVEDHVPGATPLVVASLATSARPEDGRQDTVVAHDDARLVDSVNEAWLRMAARHGIVNEDREFLLVIDGGENEAVGRRRWAKVKLLDSWDLAGKGAGTGLFGSGSGRPEFTTAPVSGDSVLRTTTYQDFVSVLFVPTLRGLTWVREYLERRCGAANDGIDEQAQWQGWLRGV